MIGGLYFVFFHHMYIYIYIYVRGCHEGIGRGYVLLEKTLLAEI